MQGQNLTPRDMTQVAELRAESDVTRFLLVVAGGRAGPPAWAHLRCGGAGRGWGASAAGAWYAVQMQLGWGWGGC